MPSNGGLIPHSRPTIGEEDIQAVTEVLRSGHLAQGEVVEQFEDAVSNYLGRRGAVATSSGTAALHLAMLALGIGPGDEVLLPSYTCSALLYAVQYSGGTPRLADINPDDYNLSAREARRLLGPQTKAVIVPHMFGVPADLEPFTTLGIPLIEDCAQALGATYRGRLVGSFGAVTVCSFYATKVITSGEGGMVLSDSEAILTRVRQLRDYNGGAPQELRFNYKMTDFQAALGISQLRRLSAFLARRKALAALYTERLQGLGALLPTPKAGATHIFYRYIARVTNARRAVQRLRLRGIESKAPVFRPLHYYLKRDGFMHTESAMRMALSIPIYPSLTDEETERILEAVRQTLDHEEEHLRRPLSTASSAP